jgi:hypothetical protein
LRAPKKWAGPDDEVFASFGIEVLVADGSWYIDYDRTDETPLGGGPHFVIDAASGEITARRYEQ